MRNRTITYTLLGVILIMCILYFTVQETFFTSSRSITHELNNIILYAQQDKWTEAQEAVDKLMKSWDKGKYIVALNYAEEDYSLFLDNLARIQGGVKTKDDTEAVNQSLSTLRLWENFTRVIPLP